MRNYTIKLREIIDFLADRTGLDRSELEGFTFERIYELTEYHQDKEVVEFYDSGKQRKD
ncbi:hypothetical protein NSA56_01880 [Oceanobacillus caeni]|uniref:hypothetical protein n=1 Tax=Oceanobacillus caeni TaxID=405946 RepID=UPI002149F8BA|nr:hypothetical protein [Oceanobacillus caeni]MCR1833146.1 hypothetical protein [Oceanobacillus caeni]